MSKLEELIEELCSSGVEYKTVGEICTTITDYTAAGSFADIAKNVKYISDGIGYAQLVRTTDLKSAFSKPDSFVYVDEHAFKYLWRVNLDCEALIMPNVGNCGEVYYITPALFPHKNNVLGPNAILVKSETVNTRYLYHLFLDKDFQSKLAKITSSTGQTKFNKTNFKTLTIPIPPLPVQEEIVRILDKFTDLTSELQSELQLELQARVKQYEYYRDTLLTFEDDVEKLPLEDILKIKNGSDYKTFKEGSYPVYGSGGIMTYVDRFAYDKPSVLIPRKGSIDKLYYVETPFWNVDTIFYTDINIDKAIPKYVFYCLQKEHLEKYNTAGGVPSLTQKALNKVEIPIPSVEVQKDIIDILDRFDVLCHNFSDILIDEIEASRKQYEYYRNKLLTFKIKNNKEVL